MNLTKPPLTSTTLCSSVTGLSVCLSLNSGWHDRHDKRLNSLSDKGAETIQPMKQSNCYLQLCCCFSCFFKKSKTVKARDASSKKQESLWKHFLIFVPVAQWVPCWIVTPESGVQTLAWHQFCFTLGKRYKMTNDVGKRLARTKNNMALSKPSFCIKDSRIRNAGVSEVDAGMNGSDCKWVSTHPPQTLIHATKTNDKRTTVGRCR